MPAFRALVIDNDDVSRATAVRILERLGATFVMEAADGASALSLVERAHPFIDLILCDLLMSQHDGIDTLGALAAHSRSSLFVLAGSADTRLLRAAAGAAKRAGISTLRVMRKPLDVGQLQEVVAALADRGPECQAASEALPIDYRFSAAEIASGLAAGQFTTFYQAKVSIADRHICGAEALIRWRHPVHGLLSANAFMGVAQASDLLDEVFSVAFPTAVADCARWAGAGYQGGISINLPVAVLGARDLPNRLDALVAQKGLTPEHVTLEVTEDGWLHQQDLAREVLTRLRIRGFGLAIDDFGTGYSGLQQLLNAPFNELKIDQSLIRTAPVDGEAELALRSMVALARHLDLTIVAEGVETEAEWDIVAEAGCDQVQGHLIAQPLGAQQFEQLLATSLTVPIHAQATDRRRTTERRQSVPNP